MAKPRNRSKKRERPHTVTLTARASFFLGLGLLFLLAWMFVLGIFVGRGFIPEGVQNISELKTKIAKLQGMLLHKSPPENLPEKRGFEDPKLAFYENLSIKKKEVARRDASREGRRKGRKPKAESRKKSPSPPRSPHYKEAATTHSFTIQLASLESADKAKALIRSLSRKGFRAYYYEVHVKGKARYRVRSGRFKTVGDAERYLKKLFNALNIKGITTRIDR